MTGAVSAERHTCGGRDEYQVQTVMRNLCCLILWHVEVKIYMSFVKKVQLSFFAVPSLCLAWLLRMPTPARRTEVLRECSSDF